MVKFLPIPLRKSINKAYLKIKPFREDFENFKDELKKLLSLINDKESEEHNKNFVRDFFKNTFYSDKYVNTKGRTDLVIHLEKSISSRAGVLIEAKSPVNKSDMITEDNLNCKAMHEVILYYLRERINDKNDEIKHIIITNAYEWFIFKADQFEKNFYNSELKKDFENWSLNLKVSSNNDFFYSKIKDFLNDFDNDLEGVHIDLRNIKLEDEKNLIPLFKIFSPAELLREPFANDSNTLNKDFYLELLHIIGLEEKKIGSKKVIQRKDPKERNSGSLLENTIRVLKSEDQYQRIKNLQLYGDTEDEQIFNIALELNITWINRILFLKLLEAQLVHYHKGDPQFRFLQSKIISQYDDLHELFHEVLAKKINERNKDLAKFRHIPYLNSSLFDISELERDTIRISGLKDRFNLPLFNHTVFPKEIKLKRELPALEYLLRFLDAFDFASEGGEEIQEERKTIINASVLGLIFEKINGYKEGSFYTPGFITMYMARETLRRAVVQKFNEYKKTDYKDYDELRRNINVDSQGREEANKIINSLKICDPAVGSGHFLVSCLNEIIAVKADLRILNDREGRQVRDFQFVIENDELVITDEINDELFSYFLNPGGKPITRLQELQETLFHEKEIIIENCLFGVDINNNSVNICRLRLWIELLKNAYYTKQSSYTELETLPNIDINIKQGNSLISRFDIKEEMFTPADKKTLEVYKLNVQLYKNEQDKNKRREFKESIEKTKKRFRGIAVDPLQKEREQISKLAEQLHKINKEDMFAGEMTDEQKEKIENKRKNLTVKIEKLSKEIEQKEAEFITIFSNSFEWRFEFPEVLDDEGNFVGFDMVIGNPPYIPIENMTEFEKEYYKRKFFVLERKYDTSVIFILHCLNIVTPKGICCHIAPITWQTGENYSKMREIIIQKKLIGRIINLPFNIFSDAYVETAIYLLTFSKKSHYKIFTFDKKTKIESFDDVEFSRILYENILPPKYKIVIDQTLNKILKRFNNEKYIPLGSITISTQGLSTSRFSKTNNKNSYPFLIKGNVYNYQLIKKEIIQVSLKDHVSLKKFYEAEPKVLIRRIVSRKDRLSVSYTDEKLVFKKDINPFIPIDSSYSAKYLLAILASKFISYLYINSSLISTKDDFRQTTLAELREILIPVLGKDEQNQFIGLIDRILNKKKQNPKADTSALEKQIDEMVYKLYGLTEEEIKIVEGSNNE